MKYTYLLIDFFTILVPLLFSFNSRLSFSKTWKAFFPAVFLTGLIFIICDMYFTRLAVWGFNYQYVTGIKIGNLPLEEVLFFFCIPYACVFTFYCITFFMTVKSPQWLDPAITLSIIIVSAIIAAFNYLQLYTFFAFAFLSLLLILSKYVVKVKWLIGFYIVYGILLVPFMIVNGLLTGTGLSAPVVWYNNSQTLGIRLLTIPLEDVFYGMDLILLNLLLYKYFMNKQLSPLITDQEV